MRCAALERAIVDRARGVALDGRVAAEIENHLRGCAACAARLEQERALSAALQQLAGSVTPSPASASAEAALLAAFDAAHAQRRVLPRSRLLYAVAAAAIVAIAALPALMTRSDGRPASVRPLESRPVAASIGALPADAARPALARGLNPMSTTTDAPAPIPFVPWPGAADLPAFESGRLMRVDLPASLAHSLGLIAGVDPGGVVPADLLIGQDGFARAVRLAP